MPVTEPTDFRVIQHLQTALRAIAVTAGYFSDVSSVAVKLDPDQAVSAMVGPSAPRPLLVIELTEEPLEFFEKPDGIRHVLTPTVYWIQDADPKDDTARLRTYARACADVERAITVDRSRGGLAFDTEIVKRGIDLQVNSSQVWSLIDLRIPIYRTYGRPVEA